MSTSEVQLCKISKLQQRDKYYIVWIQLASYKTLTNVIISALCKVIEFLY